MYNYYMEKDLQKNCIDYARSLGYMAYSFNPPNFKRMTYGTVFNMPDIRIEDLNLWVELKDKQYSKAHQERQAKQLTRRDEIIKHNGNAVKIDSFEEFKILLDTIKATR